MSTIQTSNDDKNNDAMGQVLINKGYSEKAVDYFINKPYMGMIENADIVAENTGTCGDTMIIYIKEEEGIIKDTRLQVMGCAGAVSSAMAVADLIQGKTLEEAKEINDGSVFSQLGSLPAEKHECIQLAVKTLQKALNPDKVII